MANPRKFSEKIALHTQKQAEGTAEFEKVMKEVLDVTNKSVGGMDDQLRHTHPHSHSFRERPHSAVGVGPIRARPSEKRMDHSPYSNSSYLSIPSPWRRTHSDSSLHTSSHENTSHRRAPCELSFPPDVFPSWSVDSDYEVFLVDYFLSKRVQTTSYKLRQKRRGNLPHIIKGVNECHPQHVDDYDPMKRSFSCTPEGRPRSAMDMTRVPGNCSIYPSQPDPGNNQIPIGSNTGSLPDLSNFHMASPLDAPLDSEDSPFVKNSNAGSPRSLSPTHFMQRQRLTFGSSPNEAPGPPHQINHVVSILNDQQFQNMDRSPRHSPHSRQSPQMSLYCNKFGSQSPSSSPQSPPSPNSVCKMNLPFEPSNFYISQDHTVTPLQHHFEQFSMSEDSNKLTTDLYCSPPHHQYSNLLPEPTSNTPSSIPDITLTDFSSNGEDYVDLLSEDCLREGLDPIDYVGLQMLTNPGSLIADSATEDHLRHDGL